MKIALLGMTKIKFMPYLMFYLDQIDLEKNEVYLIYWDRDEEADITVDSRIKTRCMRRDTEDSWPMKKKIPGLLQYRRFANRSIKEIKPDLMIVPYSTTAVMIYNTLISRYNQKYIFDFRDITYENIPLFRLAVERIVRHSIVSFVSSDGFRSFLPKIDKIYTVHNISISNDLHRETYKAQRNLDLKRPIRIAFWGLIRPLSVTKAVVEKMGNDPRFELHYYGRAQGEIKQLLEQAEQDSNNVYFHGTYQPKERDQFAMKTDLLFNAFEKNDRTMPYAMGNKYYDGVIYYIPQICTEGSVMGRLAEEKKIGIAIDPFSPSLSNDIYQYAMSYDRPSFFQACDSELKRVLNEADHSRVILKNILGEKNE